MKTFKQSPLPFQGQKRKFIHHFEDVLAMIPDDAVIVDLFGGSGLLAHTAKRVKPSARVIYNDFDNFSQRLQNVDKTNAILAQLRTVVAGYPDAKRLEGETKQRVIEVLREAEKQDGYVDYITLSGSLMFSSCYGTSLADFERGNLYNRIRQNDYEVNGYLDGLEVVRGDYRELFHQFKDAPNVLFLIDPPYLCTDVATYTMTWRLRDYLDVLRLLVGTKYIYFTSDKSAIIELCQWMGDNADIGNPFANARREDINSMPNYASKYTDIMLYNV